MIREGKTDQVRLALKEGDHREALKIGKDFRYGMTEAERKQVVRGWECCWNQRFYEDLGFDVIDEIEKAVEILSDVVWHI